MKTADDQIKTIAKYFVPASYQSILRALEYEDLTVVQMSRKLNADRSTLQKALLKLTEWKIVHVHDWLPPSGSGQWTRIYRIGQGVNKKRPAAKPGAELAREYRARQRQQNSKSALWGVPCPL